MTPASESGAAAAKPKFGKGKATDIETSEEVLKMQAAMWTMQQESMAMRQYCSQMQMAANQAIIEGDAVAKAKIQEIRADANKYKQTLAGIETMVDAMIGVATNDNPATIDARVLKAMVQSSKINAPAVEEALPEHIVDVPQWPIPPDSYKTPN